MKPFSFENDSDTARECVDELIGLARSAEVNDEAKTALEDCRGELFLCVDRLEEEIRRLRSQIEDLTDFRRDDPHP